LGLRLPRLLPTALQMLQLLLALLLLLSLLLTLKLLELLLLELLLLASLLLKLLLLLLSLLPLRLLQLRLLLLLLLLLQMWRRRPSTCTADELRGQRRRRRLDAREQRLLHGDDVGRRATTTLLHGDDVGRRAAATLLHGTDGATVRLQLCHRRACTSAVGPRRNCGANGSRRRKTRAARTR
jgi:hypothetical protein